MRISDIARSAYTALPPSVKNAIAPIIALVPSRLRYGATFDRWSADIRRSRNESDFAVQRTERQLQALLAKAATGSSFWRDIIGERDFQSFRLEDLASLSLTTKDMLRAAGAAANVESPPAVVRATTSGSNGEAPFSFWVDADRSVREFAFVANAWARCGYRPGDARAVFRGLRLEGANRHFAWDRALAELRLSVFPLGASEVASIADEIDRRRIEFLHGYPSAIEVFARELDRTGRRLARPIQGVLPISEPVFSHQRTLFEHVFPGALIVPFYGLSEKVAFAAERPGEPGIYTFEPLYGVAELVDQSGNAISQMGGEGRIVATGFVSTGMPFIRYDTGDCARLIDAPTRRNGWRLTVSELVPRRKPGFLRAADGSRIVATDLVPENPELTRGLLEWQFEQHSVGVCAFRYVLDRDGTDTDAWRVVHALEERVSHAIRLHPVQVARIASGNHGKRPFIVHKSLGE